MKGLDLSKFRKVASEKEHTTLKHYAGHEIKIKHSALSSKMREQLEALPMSKAKPVKMADGGYMKESPSTGKPAYNNAVPADAPNERISVPAGGVRLPSRNDGMKSGVPNYGSGGGSNMGAPKMNEEGEQYADGGYIPSNGRNVTTDPGNGTFTDMLSGGKDKGSGGDDSKGGGGGAGGLGALALLAAEGGKVPSLDAQAAPPEAADEASDPRLAELAQTAPTEGDPTFDTEPKTEVPPTQTSQAQVDPATLRKRELYNQFATQNFGPNQPNTMGNGMTFGPNGEEPKNFNANAWNSASQRYQAELKSNETATIAKAQATAAKAQATADTNKARVDAGLAPLPTELPSGGPAPQGTAQAANALASEPATPPKGAEPPSAMEGYAGNMAKGYGLQMQGIEEQKQATQQSSQAQAGLLQQAAQQNQKNINDQQQRIAAFQQANQDFIHDVQQGYIKPKDMFHDKSAMGKVSTAIGLLLGGMAQGQLGLATNPAVDFMNKQIDRDMAAQQHNLQAKENLLHHNLETFKDLNTAAAVTRMQYNDFYANMIDRAKAQASNPQAAAAADMAKGDLMQKNAMIMSMLGQHGSIPGQSGGAGGTEAYLNMLRMTNPPMAKEIESRYVPGIGIASIPLSETTRSTLVERKLLGDNIQQLIAFQQKHGGTLQGIADPSVRAQGEAIAKQVQDQYRRANQQGVFKPAEAEFVNGVIADSPSSLFSKYTKLPAYRAAAQINAGNLNALYKSVGLQPQGQPAQSSGFVPKSFKPSR